MSLCCVRCNIKILGKFHYCRLCRLKYVLCDCCHDVLSFKEFKDHHVHDQRLPVISEDGNYHYRIREDLTCNAFLSYYNQCSVCSNEILILNHEMSKECKVCNDIFCQMCSNDTSHEHSQENKTTKFFYNRTGIGMMRMVSSLSGRSAY